jgi:hypothetical protein
VTSILVWQYLNSKNSKTHYNILEFYWRIMKRSAELSSNVDDAMTSSRARLAIEYDVWTFSDDGQVMFKLSSGANKSDSLFAFDMDGCLIVPKDPKKAYSSTADDWNLFHHSAFTPSPVPGKLRAMHDEGRRCFRRTFIH